MEQERRAFRRFTLNQFIKLSTGKEEFMNARGINISKVGMLCESSEIIELYSRFYLLVTLDFADSQETIELEGVVVHCERKGDLTHFGIRFSDMRPDSEMILGMYIDELSESGS